MILGFQHVRVMYGEVALFPGVLPPSLSPLTQNGIAAGGLAAILLSTAFHLMPGPRLAFAMRPSVAQLPARIDRFNEGAQILKLTPAELSALHLACEEVSIHVASHFEDQKHPGSVHFRVIKDDDGVFAEIQAGRKLRDVNGAGPRFSSGWTKKSDVEVTVDERPGSRIDGNSVLVSSFFRLPRNTLL